MAKCCKQTCDTPFCPLCGTEVELDPIFGLMKHINAAIRIRKKEIELEITRRGRLSGDDKILQRQSRTLAKWESWRLALTKWIMLSLQSDQDQSPTSHSEGPTPPQSGPTA